MDAAQNPAVTGLPAHTSHLHAQGREIYLVGTAHVSLESIDDVRKTVELVEPDTICVELCQARYEAFTRPDAWQRMDVFKVIKEGKAVLLLRPVDHVGVLQAHGRSARGSARSRYAGGYQTGP